MGGDTRARILAVATELFTDQGYEATSLRQIADRLGFTKAALYYHFQSKEQILTALLEPTGALLAGFVERLRAADGLDGFAQALDWALTQMLEHLDLFRVALRNRQAMAAFHTAITDSGKHPMVFAAVQGKAADLPQQVRMIAALAAVSAFDDWAPDLLADKPELVVAELRAITRDILGLPRTRRSRPPMSRVAVGPGKA
jgi:AcrR family transcriptional regulator